MKSKLRTDPIEEAMARKLSGICGVPPIEQAKMIRNAVRIGRKMLQETKDKNENHIRNDV